VSMEIGRRAELGSAWVRMLVPLTFSPARGPPTEWGELVQVHDECDVTQTSPDELSVIDLPSP